MMTLIYGKFSRFKGLGEMNPEQLQETTMDIKTRELGLLEYDENKKEEIQETFDILMGDNPDKRKHFINTISQTWSDWK